MKAVQIHAYGGLENNTHKMAEAIADGARSIEATEATKEEACVCDALLLGTPLRDRSIDARVQRFIENTVS